MYFICWFICVNCVFQKGIGALGVWRDTVPVSEEAVSGVDRAGTPAMCTLGMSPMSLCHAQCHPQLWLRTRSAQPFVWTCPPFETYTFMHMVCKYHLWSIHFLEMEDHCLFNYRNYQIPQYIFAHICLIYIVNKHLFAHIYDLRSKQTNVFGYDLQFILLFVKGTCI